MRTQGAPTLLAAATNATTKKTIITTMTTASSTPMTRGFTLRQAVSADAGLVLKLIRELAEYERLAHEVVATEETLREQLFGARPAAEVTLATDRATGETAGFALYFQNFSTFLARPGLYLEDLFVRPAYRRRGLGKLLLRTLGQLAVERGCGRFEWSVLDWNADAIAFYRSLGAELMDGWTTCRVSGPALARLGSVE